MRKRIWSCVWLLFVTFFLCQGCIGNAKKESNNSKNLTKEEVLQKYLDAGFQIDSAATAGKETFVTLEDAMAALAEWSVWIDQLEVFQINDSTEYELKYVQIPEKNNRYFYAFRYKYLQISFVTDGNGNAAFESLGGTFYEAPRIVKVPPVVDFYPVESPVTPPDMSFRLSASVRISVVIGGTVLSHERTVVLGRCQTDMSVKKIIVWKE